MSDLFTLMSTYFFLIDLPSSIRENVIATTSIAMSIVIKVQGL
jgi:hypothetical protein